MKDAVTIGVITSMSTLSAVALTGVISLRIARIQAQHQAQQSATELRHQQSARRRDIRRDSYIHFLSRADEAYRRLDDRWNNPPPGEPEPPRTDQAYLALRALDETYNRILLDGPTDVVVRAGTLVESVNVEYHNQSKALALHPNALEGLSKLEPTRFSSAIATRMLKRAEFTQVARRAVDGDATD